MLAAAILFSVWLIWLQPKFAVSRNVSSKVRVAICMAGEVRTLVEDDVLAHLNVALLQRYRETASVDVFAVLSTGTRQVLRDFSSTLNLTRIKERLSLPLDLLRPLRLELLNDTEIADRPDFDQAFCAATNTQCMLYWRWSRCEAMISEEERRRGSKYAFVIRVRPDLEYYRLLPSVAELAMRKASEVFVEWDIIMIMRREAATISLQIYPNAAGYHPCMDGPHELCVLSALAATGFEMHTMGGAVGLRRACKLKDEQVNSLLRSTCNGTWDSKPPPTLPSIIDPEPFDIVGKYYPWLNSYKQFKYPPR